MAEKKKKWIKKALNPEHKGLFKEKAEHAGKSTKEYAEEKSSAPGKLGKEARLAKSLMGMHKGGHNLRKKMYGHKSD
jgi:transcription antitermination factor NusA-like protein